MYQELDGCLTEVITIRELSAGWPNGHRLQWLDRSDHLIEA